MQQARVVLGLCRRLMRSEPVTISIPSCGVINDNERQVPTTFSEALHAYSIQPIAWSQRDTATEALVA